MTIFLFSHIRLYQKLILIVLVREVKQQYILLFDYNGKKYFSIKIYNTNGIELDYRGVQPCKCKSEKGFTFKESEYIVGIDIIEEEKKAKSVLHFNGFRGSLAYHKQKINSSDIARFDRSFMI